MRNIIAHKYVWFIILQNLKLNYFHLYCIRIAACLVMERPRYPADKRPAGFVDVSKSNTLLTQKGVIERCRQYHESYIQQQFCTFCTNDLPDVFETYFVTKSHVHQHYTRNSNNLHKVFTRTNYRKHTVLIKGIDIWNNYAVFRQRAKFYCLNTQTV